MHANFSTISINRSMNFHYSFSMWICDWNLETWNSFLLFMFVSKCYKKIKFWWSSKKKHTLSYSHYGFEQNAFFQFLCGDHLESLNLFVRFIVRNISKFSFSVLLPTFPFDFGICSFFWSLKLFKNLYYLLLTIQNITMFFANFTLFINILIDWYPKTLVCPKQVFCIL